MFRGPPSPLSRDKLDQVEGVRIQGVVDRKQDGEGDLPRSERLWDTPTFLPAEIAIVDADDPVGAAGQR